MWSRSLPFLLSTGVSLLAAGCFIDSGPFPSQATGGEAGSGAGGTAGSGATSSGGTGGSGGSGGTTTTTAPPECTVAEDCPDHGACTTRACEDGKCVHTDKPAGTAVSDESMTDCVDVVCDSTGAETTVPDDTEVPEDTPEECTTKICSQGREQIVNVADDTLCGEQPSNPCQEQVCTAGQCGVQNKPDGTTFPDQWPNDCATTKCEGGAGYYIGGFNGMCGADQTPNDCFMPFCNVATLPGQCISYFVEANTPCKKPNSMNGFCDSLGNCN